MSRHFLIYYQTFDFMCKESILSHLNNKLRVLNNSIVDSASAYKSNLGLKFLAITTEEKICQIPYGFFDYQDKTAHLMKISDFGIPLSQVGMLNLILDSEDVPVIRIELENITHCCNRDQNMSYCYLIQYDDRVPDPLEHVTGHNQVTDFFFFETESKYLAVVTENPVSQIPLLRVTRLPSFNAPLEEVGARNILSMCNVPGINRVFEIIDNRRRRGYIR